ncbi:hypothetical protein OA512_01225 [SAR86 cluster bacterium]|nr:hypothetical protein [SAR86 cluster bacterium]
MKLIKIYFITIIFFNSALFAGLNTTEKNDFIYQKKEEIPIAKFDVNKKILNDSLVLQWNQETNIEGFKKLGNFLYKLNAIEQSNENIINVNKNKKNLRLVEVRGHKYMISDSSFIIEFGQETDRQKFNMEYALIPKYEMGSRTAYQPLGFENLNEFFKRFNADDRVISYELDLIDPNVVLQ